MSASEAAIPGAPARGALTVWVGVQNAFRGNRSLRTGACILGSMVCVGLLGVVALPDPNRQDLTASFAPPGSSGHLLGTDSLGRDVLAWVSSGVLLGLGVALLVVLISTVVGVAVGLCAGYFGGMVDTALMRLVDLELAVPPLLLFIAAAAVLDTGLFTTVMLLSAVAWLTYARVVRNQVLVERERGYIAAARLAGASRTRLLVRHLLPAVSTSALVLSSLQAGYVFLWESGLSFLGFGLRPPSNSLGYLISQGRSTLVEAWWVVVFPGIGVALLVLAANLIGDGLRDAVHQDVDLLKP